MKKIYPILLFLCIIGILDASYLLFEHYSNTVPPCYVHAVFTDCGKVLSSSYATILHIPVPMLGVIYYFSLLSLMCILLYKKSSKAQYLLFVLSGIGFLMSLYFVFLQLFIIKAICLYCMTSAFISTSLFFIISYFNRNKSHIYGK